LPTLCAVEQMSNKAELVVEGKKLAVSNLNKVLYPKVGFTKGQVIDYYIRIAPALLPHLRDRPLTMKRYPNGVEAEFFYEKNCPAHRPKWVKTAKVWSEGNNRIMHYCLAQDLPTLVWAANLADLELHTSLAKKKDVARPTVMVFDLDPGAPADIVQCCEVGLWLRNLLSEMKLKSFAKTSGSKGLQVYVPLNTFATFDETKDLSRALAQHLERQHPDLVTSNMSKALRKGKIFVDWSQNDEHKTTVCVYSLRAKEEPTVSTPVTWDEIENCLKKKKAELLKFRCDRTVERVQKMGDLFHPVEEFKQKLPKKWKL
jgi:bifunctional non-homologous end joining protein LigD